jgi:predicted  nucleic acid-binding Zn-ribbon protein
MVEMSLEHRLKLAKTALSAAEANAQDVNKNPAYWQSQVEQEKKLVESLEAEIQKGESQDASNPCP